MFVNVHRHFVGKFPILQASGSNDLTLLCATTNLPIGRNISIFSAQTGKTMATFKDVTPPSDGKAITISGGKLQVPDRPIIPFIEGDGTGPDN
jgi:hypothetical protein